MLVCVTVTAQNSAKWALLRAFAGPKMSNAFDQRDEHIKNHGFVIILLGFRAPVPTCSKSHCQTNCIRACTLASALRLFILSGKVKHKQCEIHFIFAWYLICIHCLSKEVQLEDFRYMNFCGQVAVAVAVAVPVAAAGAMTVAVADMKVAVAMAVASSQ